MNGLRTEVPRYGSDVPGLPDKAVAITNSERSRTACPSSWLYAYPDRLAPQGRSRGLTWGTAWHEWLEDVHRWWMVHDTEYPWEVPGQRAGDGCPWCGGAGCDHCNGTGASPLFRARQEWLYNADEQYSEDDAEKDADALYRAAEGWAHMYSLAPPTDYRVVAVEQKLAVPILGPTGEPYRPQTWVVPDESGGLRLAGTGEAHSLGAQVVRWPWYQVLTIDALFQHRESGNLYVGEHKSAASPTSRVQAVIVDPQLAGYVWAAGVALERGTLDHLGLGRDCRVRGYRYDVTSNKYQPDPKMLKPEKVKALHPDTGEPYKVKGRWVYQLDGEGQPVMRSALSTSRQAAVPSWRFRAAIDAHGLDPADYQDHLLELSKVDGKLYQRLNGTSGPEVGQRYARELWAVAQKISTWRRRAATLTTQAERDLHFPRQPVCMTGYGCPWRGPCLQDGELVRRDFDLADTQRWVPADHNEAQEDLGW